MATLSESAPDFGTAWQRYCLVERRFWLALFLDVGVVLACTTLANTDSSLAWKVALVPFAGLVVMIPFWQSHSRTLTCPYCGAFFYDQSFVGRYEPSTCVNCGKRRPGIWGGPA